MEDFGVPPKPTHDPSAARVPDTPGLHLIPSGYLHISNASRKTDGLFKETSHSVMKTDPQFPSQSQQPVDLAALLFNTATECGNTYLDKPGGARKSPKATDPSKWKKNKQKQLRMEGKAYVSKRKKDGEVVSKQPRVMGPRCTSDVCRKAFNRLCSEIDEETRKNVFEEFWQCMNWAERRLYVAGQVDRTPVQRSRALGKHSRRAVSLRYYLMVEGERKQVCKNMFLSTLGIGEWSVLSWAQSGNAKWSESKEAKSPELEGSSKRKSGDAKPMTWKKNQQKRLRMEGKPYISKQKKDGATITRAQRTMGSRCTSDACKRASNRFCTDFSEETRNTLFTHFWQDMDWTQRRSYVVELVNCKLVERTRAPWTQSRRSASMQYHLRADGDRKQVCKKMFLSTLGIGEWSVLNWAQNASQQNNSDNTEKAKHRKSCKAAEHKVLKDFLVSLPKIPSTVTSVSKLYLEPVFSNMSEVYRFYQNHCLEKKAPTLSRQVFCAVFKKMDLALFVPKSGQDFISKQQKTF